MSVLEFTISQTKVFLDSMPKSVRKKKGQFFTSIEISDYMAQLFDISNCEDEVTVLDPGAGTGILSVAFADRILNESPNIRINLTCYETDTDVLPVLKRNL